MHGRNVVSWTACFEWWRRGERVISNVVDDLVEIVKWGRLLGSRSEDEQNCLKMYYTSQKCKHWHWSCTHKCCRHSPAASAQAQYASVALWKPFEQNKKLPGHGDLAWKQQWGSAYQSKHSLKRTFTGHIWRKGIKMWKTKIWSDDQVRAGVARCQHKTKSILGWSTSKPGRE